MRRPLVLLICTLVLLSGCYLPPDLVYRDPTPTPVSGAELPFEFIGREWFSAYQGSEPALFIATSGADAPIVAANLDASYAEDFLARAQQIQPGQVLLLLLRGHYPMGGHEIRANRVVLSGDELYVYAELCDRGVGVAAETSFFYVAQATLPPEAAATAASLKPVLVAYPVNCWDKP